MDSVTLDAIHRTVTNAVETLRVAGYAGTAEQLRGAAAVLVGELRGQEELPTPESAVGTTQRKKAATR